jgi:hypothetical protein
LEAKEKQSATKYTNMHFINITELYKYQIKLYLSHTHG